MKKHIYIYEKILTFVLAFAMIVGFWSGMTLDARAEDQVIDDVEITVEAPVPGQSFPGVKGVRVITPEDEIDVIKVVWWNYSNGYNEVAQDSTVEYNTKYMVRVWLQAKDNYKFAKDALDKIKINDSSEHISGNLESDQKVLVATHNFEETAPDPAKTINSVNIEIDPPVAGKVLATACSASEPGVTADWITWYYKDANLGEESETSGPAAYNTVYWVSVRLAPKTMKGYEFAPGMKVTINKQDITNLTVGELKAIYVSYTFPVTEPEPSGGEIVPGNTGTTQPANDSNDSESKPRHICSFEWVITVDPTTGADGLEEYKCTGCGAVSESHPIPASIAVVKDFYGKVKEAPEKGSITYDAGKLYTISDYILKKMAERNDVSVTVKFEYKNRKYQLIFPAGLDYSAVLTDKEIMYGYFGAAAKLGLKVTEQ